MSMTKGAELKFTPRIMINRFGFESEKWKFYAQLSKEKAQEIYDYLYSYYGEEIDEQLYIDYVINNTCRHCLEFGHTCDKTEFPPSCPNLPTDFAHRVREYASKYNLSTQRVSELALSFAGFERPLPGNFKYIIWSWSMFDYYLEKGIDLCRNDAFIRSTL